MPDVVNGYKWKLYDLAKDFSQADDLADANPNKLHELQALFLVEATRNHVFPLSNNVLERIIAPKPSYTAARTEFAYTRPVSGIPTNDAPGIIGKSFTITAKVEIPKRGTEGMIVTDGGRFGGYGAVLLRGKPVFTHNLLALERARWEGRDVLAPGKHEIVFDFKYDGPGPGKCGTGVLKVDGKESDRKQIPHTIPFLLTIDETFDVGMDTRTPVDDHDYQVPFPFTGRIEKVAFKPTPPPAPK